MSPQDDEAERIARAKQLREQIDAMTGGSSGDPAAPGMPRKMSPREFTDQAAAEAARQAQQKKKDRGNE